MASWALLPAFSGFGCDVERRIVRLAIPADVAEFRTLVICGGGWGIFSQTVDDQQQVHAQLVTLGGVCCDYLLFIPGLNCHLPRDLPVDQIQEGDALHARAVRIAAGLAVCQCGTVVHDPLDHVRHLPAAQVVPVTGDRRLAEIDPGLAGWMQMIEHPQLRIVGKEIDHRQSIARLESRAYGRGADCIARVGTAHDRLRAQTDGLMF
jgi:hypothetical protein